MKPLEETSLARAGPYDIHDRFGHGGIRGRSGQLLFLGDTGFRRHG